MTAAALITVFAVVGWREWRAVSLAAISTLWTADEALKELTLSCEAALPFIASGTEVAPHRPDGSTKAWNANATAGFDRDFHGGWERNRLMLSSCHFHSDLKAMAWTMQQAAEVVSIRQDAGQLSEASINRYRNKLSKRCWKPLHAAVRSQLQSTWSQRSTLAAVTQEEVDRATCTFQALRLLSDVAMMLDDDAVQATLLLDMAEWARQRARDVTTTAPATAMTWKLNRTVVLEELLILWFPASAVPPEPATLAAWSAAKVAYLVSMCDDPRRWTTLYQRLAKWCPRLDVQLPLVPRKEVGKWQPECTGFSGAEDLKTLRWLAVSDATRAGHAAAVGSDPDTSATSGGGGLTGRESKPIPSECNRDTPLDATAVAVTGEQQHRGTSFLHRLVPMEATVVHDDGSKSSLLEGTFLVVDAIGCLCNSTAAISQTP